MSKILLPEDALGQAVEDAYLEVRRAKSIHGPEPFHSTHEGYAVLLEEVRELEDEVFFGKKRAKNIALNIHEGYYLGAGITIEQKTATLHKEKLREEAIQVAAMALRFASELTV